MKIKCVFSMKIKVGGKMEVDQQSLRGEIDG